VLIDSDPEQADELLAEALARARDLDERYLSGVALVAAASARSRHGNPHDAAELFGEVVRHWRDRDDWTHQWTTLRNVVDLLVRLDRSEAAAVLVAALTDRGGPATGYGSDATRLTETHDRLAAQLGADQLLRLTARGRSLTDQALLDHALQALDAATTTQPSGDADSRAEAATR
jgi:hypothetical protein